MQIFRLVLMNVAYDVEKIEAVVLLWIIERLKLKELAGFFAN